MLAILYWPVAVALMALGQGLLLPAIKRTAPGSEARRQGLALHYVLVLSYYLPLTLLGVSSLLSGVLVATVSRLLLFDVVLNTAAGVAPFHVGNSAAADQLLQRVALGLHWPPDRVRLVGWVACVVGTIVALGWYLWG
jgi:hypothetical protein